MKAWNLTEMKQLLSVARKDNESFYILLLVSILHGLRVSAYQPAEEKLRFDRRADEAARQAAQG
jgi:hypothetical protein